MLPLKFFTSKTIGLALVSLAHMQSVTFKYRIDQLSKHADIKLLFTYISQAKS